MFLPVRVEPTLQMLREVMAAHAARLPPAVAAALTGPHRAPSAPDLPGLCLASGVQPDMGIFRRVVGDAVVPRIRGLLRAFDKATPAEITAEAARRLQAHQGVDGTKVELKADVARRSVRPPPLEPDRSYEPRPS